MTTPVRIVVLGCGRAATTHSRVLRRLGGVELSYASRDPARAEAYRRRHGGRRAYGSYDEALADAGNRVALVTTPTASHHELTMRALDADRDVIVEKPAFMRSADVQAVHAAAASRGRQVFVAENYFYRPMTRRLRLWISRGDLGDVRFVAVNATRHQPVAGWREDPSMSGGGALFEGGIHWINFLSNISLDVAQVTGFRSGASVGPDRSALVVFRYTSGAVGTLAYSWELPAPLGGLRLSKVQGTHGAVTFETNGLLYVKTGRRRGVGFPALRDPSGYRAMHRDFLNAIRTGAAPQFTLELAHRDLCLLERAQRTAMAR